MTSEQRCAVVLGGTSGPGRAIALGLAASGMAVVASSRTPGPVDRLAAHIEAAGVRTLRLTSDVSDRACLVFLRDAVLAEFGAVEATTFHTGQILAVDGGFLASGVNQ